MSTAADEHNNEMLKIVEAIRVARAEDRSIPADTFPRFVNLAQACPLSTLSAVLLEEEHPLFLAAAYRKPEYCLLFLARGARVATIADIYCYPTLVGLLHVWAMDVRRGEDVVVRARRFAAEADVVRVLVRGGVDTDALGFDKHSPLLAACEYGNASVVEALLAAPGERIGWGRGGEVVVDAFDSPLVQAICREHLEVVMVLCRPEFWPKSIVVDDKGEILKAVATRYGSKEIALFISGLNYDSCV